MIRVGALRGSCSSVVSGMCEAAAGPLASQRSGPAILQSKRYGSALSHPMALEIRRNRHCIPATAHRQSLRAGIDAAGIPDAAAPKRDEALAVIAVRKEMGFHHTSKCPRDIDGRCLSCTTTDVKSRPKLRSFKLLVRDQIRDLVHALFSHLPGNTQGHEANILYRQARVHFGRCIADKTTL